MNYILLGVPTPLARARHGNGNVYDSQKKIKFAIGCDLRMQHGQRPIHQGPLRLEIDFYFTPPESWSDRKKEGCYGTPHIFKPDTSNLLKLIEDVGNGIIWKDDCLIAYTNISKTYDRVARTEFRIIEI
jgi:Holliday junction resolvase RusA-like endonuclease